MWSATVRWPTKLSEGRWNTYPSPWRRRCRRDRADVPETRRPSTASPPEVGRSMPAIKRSSDDLPLPEGPTTAVTRPRGNSADTPRSAWTSPVGVRYVRTRSSHRTIAGSFGNPKHLPEWRPLLGPIGEEASGRGGDRDRKGTDHDRDHRLDEQWPRRDRGQGIHVGDDDAGS